MIDCRYCYSLERHDTTHRNDPEVVRLNADRLNADTDDYWKHDARGLRICDHGWDEDDGCGAGCFG